MIGHGLRAGLRHPQVEVRDLSAGDADAANLTDLHRPLGRARRRPRADLVLPPEQRRKERRVIGTSLEPACEHGDMHAGPRLGQVPDLHLSPLPTRGDVHDDGTVVPTDLGDDASRAAGFEPAFGRRVRIGELPHVAQLAGVLKPWWGRPRYGNFLRYASVPDAV